MLFEPIRQATRRQLRQFAAALLVVAVLAVMRSGWQNGHVPLITSAVAAVALISGVAGLISPRSIDWLFRAMTTLMWPVGVVVSESMLALLYFVVVTPVAAVLRLSRRDRLNRTRDSRARSYWIDVHRPDDPSRYFRQS